MCDNFCLFLNLHFFQRDSYIARWLASPHSTGGLEGKSKALVAVTHLALLGVKRQEAAFWVFIQKKKAVLRDCFFGMTNIFQEREIESGQVGIK